MHIEYMRDKSKEMPVIDCPIEIKSMTIWHCNFRSFAEISKCVNLEQFQVASAY